MTDCFIGWNRLCFMAWVLGCVLPISVGAQATMPTQPTWETLSKEGYEAFQQERFGEAARLYEMAVEKTGDNLNARIHALRCLAATKARLGNLKDAAADFESAKAIAEQAELRGEPWSELLKDLALVYFDAREYEKCRQTHRRLVDDLDKTDTNRQFTAYLGYAHGTLAAGAADEAIALYKICLALAEERKEPNLVGGALTQISYACMVDGDAEEALRWANLRAERFPEDGFSYQARAYVHIYAGKWEAAAADTQKSWEIMPTDLRALFLWIANARQGKMEEATAQLREHVHKVELSGPRKQLADWILAGRVGEVTLTPVDDQRFHQLHLAHSTFLAAEALLARGRHTDARVLLEKVRSSSHPIFTEYFLANTELKRLDADRDRVP